MNLKKNIRNKEKSWKTDFFSFTKSIKKVIIYTRFFEEKDKNNLLYFLIMLYLNILIGLFIGGSYEFMENNMYSFR